MKIAIRHILWALTGVGLLLGHRASAQQSDWAMPQSTSQGRATDSAAPPPMSQGRVEVLPKDERIGPPTPDSMPDPNLPIVGENQTPVGGIFGDKPPAACEFCGGGGCLPPTWSAESSLSVLSMSRPRDARLGAYSLPAGPLSAGSITVTNSNGVTTSNVYSQYLNDAVQQTALETHTPSISDSPSWGLTLTRFLGRDGEERDHFIDIAFNGFQNYSSAMTVHGSEIPFYNTAPFPQTIPATPPMTLYYQGSLVSPAPIFLPITGNQQQLIAPSFSLLGRNYDQAFNRSDTMSTSYTSNYNELELNYRFAGRNQPDQLVLNPNGRWYRECQTGYYYSYFFGLKGMVIDEDFNFSSSGSQFGAAQDPTAPGAVPEYTHQGAYGVHTYNTLLGFQTGGKLEYRFCRWCLDTHGNAGMFLNFARQDTHITTAFTGTPDAASTYLNLPNTDNSFGASTTAVAFAGGFGVSGSYKILPNLVGHISYDMIFVGDVARAPEQVEFSPVPETARNLINTQGAIFYDGVSFGVEWDW